MTGGTLPPGPVTEKVSVLHWVCQVTGLPVPMVGVPPICKLTVVVMVFGPAITKVFMSIRN